MLQVFTALCRMLIAITAGINNLNTFGILHDLWEFAASKLPAAEMVKIQHLDIARQVVIAIFQ